jgi:hypothetical protein
MTEPKDVKPNMIYKSGDGEYFKAIERNGQIVLSNPSYPFVFLPQVLQPLEEIGEAEKYEHLVEKVESQWFTGETLSVDVTPKGDLEVQNDKTKKGQDAK